MNSIPVHKIYPVIITFRKKSFSPYPSTPPLISVTCSKNIFRLNPIAIAIIIRYKISNLYN